MLQRPVSPALTTEPPGWAFGAEGSREGSGEGTAAHLLRYENYIVYIYGVYNGD